MNDKASLSAHNVSRVYDGTAVVSGVSLDLPPGVITALLGGSGAGKSTLLRLMAGLEPVDSGEIRLGDRVLSSPGHTLAPEKRHIGLIFQDFALFPHLTALQNIGFGLADMPREEARAIGTQWLSRLGLGARSGAYPHELSGGEQQRVAIARALAPKPAAILMDEPFSGLDPSLRGSVREEALAAIRDAGIPALLVTHDPAEALDSADHIAIMRSGHILQQGPARDIYLKPQGADIAAALGAVNIMAAADMPPGLLTPAPPAGSTLVVRPEGILLDASAPVKARVVSSRLTGPMSRLVLDAGPMRMVALVPRFDAPAAGAEIGIRFDPALAFIFASGAS
ncbi:ABC transporter ATP-binding protein [Hyphomonas johnsonii]|uniref:Iron ABC transporter ATP-binding protein n=1 Tax=Hyphomonas johnsonii MHS-2 TaxID=1280950 RepID=A0A059FAR1_9PROT|nr:ABC transporter ATP-binding protein [Hyphomonas johnsonii]KCZ87613.1 iron ABC transporter ATP-binding protein [Hyphomonas johnsonii MHS-2]